MSSTRTLLALALAALATLPTAASAQDAPALDALLARFAALPGLEAHFVEEKRVALLAVPMRSEGQIYFAHPGRLMRRVERPDPSQALISEGQLTMRAGGRTQQIAISENPVLRGFVDSFRAVLAGDREQLLRFYRAELTARPDDGDDAWTLVLHPRSPELRQFLRVITLRGVGVRIESMHMVEDNGDETRTEFRDVRTDRRFSNAEARRIFSIR